MSEGIWKFTANANFSTWYSYKNLIENWFARYLTETSYELKNIELKSLGSLMYV